MHTEEHYRLSTSAWLCRGYDKKGAHAAIFTRWTCWLAGYYNLLRLAIYIYIYTFWTPSPPCTYWGIYWCRECFQEAKLSSQKRGKIFLKKFINWQNSIYNSGIYKYLKYITLNNSIILLRTRLTWSTYLIRGTLIKFPLEYYHFFFWG